jgi:hypothetical protein
MTTALRLLIVFAANAFASPFTLQAQKFELNAPKNWSHVLPNDNNLLLQGPETRGQARPMVFVSYTQLKDVKFNPAGMQVRIGSYTEGRRRYIRAKGGHLLRVIPYTHKSEGAGNEIHSTGVDYKIGHETYFERTSFISCHGSVFHVKTIDFSDPKAKQSANSIGQTFKCAR